ncbi:MAG: SsrA-binding protein SmpB [Silvanigrellaceae bacterium]
MKSISKNRRAFHEYSIEDKFEAGIALRGSEVKILRDSSPSLAESYAMIREGQAWLMNLTIPTLKQASYLNHAERRDRRLLLKRTEIKKLDEATRQKGYTLVPLELYFNDDNRVKVELAIAKGKAGHDKREAQKEKDAKREMSRAVRR